MDQATLQKIARLRTLSARQGKSFDVVQFATDHEFAKKTLIQVMDTSDEELLLVGLEVMNALQMIPAAKSAPAVPAAAKTASVSDEKPTNSTIEQRYVGRLR